MTDVDASDADQNPHTSDEHAPGTRMEKASAQVLELVGRVIDDGVGPLTGSIAWAEDRLSRIQGDRYRGNTGRTRTTADAAERDDLEKTIKRLTHESIEAAGLAGFVTGLGGFIAMPITIPANLAGALVINARLAAAIAYLRGYDVTDPHVRTVATLVAVGSSAQEVVRELGVKLGAHLAMTAIKKLPITVIRQVNKKAGVMLITKYGTKRGLVTLAKGVPVAGGLIGGAVDATMTGLIGRTAAALFVVE